MNLPQSWNEIDVVQFREIRELYSIEDGFTRDLEILAALSNVSSDELEDYDISEVTNLFKSITFINSEPSKNYKHDLNQWKFKPFSKLTCGEFIDLEYFFTNDYSKHIGHIAAICYRKHKLNEWNELIFEPYDFNPFDRCYEFDDFKIVDIYGLIPEYLTFRENFLNTYSNLFDEGEQDEDDEEDKPQTSEEVKAQKERQSARKWGWERMLYSLCNEDLTKMRQVTNLPLVLTFNMLGMKKELNL